MEAYRERVRVLLVEDNEGDAVLVETMLTEASTRVSFEVTHVTRIQQLEPALSAQPPDVILLDLSLPDSQGAESFLRARALAAETPIVVMTGLDDEEMDGRTASLGAHGYLVKGELSPSALRRQIRHAIERGRALNEVEQARVAATELATQDPLTGLVNRLVLDDRLQGMVNQARRRGSLVGVLMIDLDRFKWLNDSFGHALGDEVLQSVARRITREVRESDTVARLGGDEFVVLLGDLWREMDAARVASKLIHTIRQPIVVAGQSCTTGASIGIATFPNDAADPETLLAQADAAMYRAKRSGAGQYRFHHHETTALAAGRLEVERDLRRALERDELRLRFQPVVSVESGAIVGLEALVRWDHPERDMLVPPSFLPIAEEMGLIADLGSWVLDETCRWLADWCAAGHSDVRASVNVSVQQLRDVGFPALVASTLRRHGVPASALAIEVREDAFLGEAEPVQRTIWAVAELGVATEIDDFGSGVACLPRMSEIDISAIKVDRRLVRGVTENPRDARLVSGIVALASGLGARCVAEGVETPQQLAALRELGCALAQGFLFSPPVTPEEAGGLLVAKKKLG